MKYLKDSETKISIKSGSYNNIEHGYFFRTPGGNWFFQPKCGREITYIELRRLYNKLYILNKEKYKS
jgi:hypothetical protein